jgi:hypothetical protein
MPYTVELPDGRSVEFPDSVPKEKAAEIIRTQLGIGEGKKGFGAALGKGFESALSSGRAGLAGLTGSPEEAAIAGLERGKRINTEYADQIGFDKVKEAYGRGLLPAVGEVARQAPLALAEQFPNLAAMAGSARAGAMAGARFGPYGGIAGGLAGALAPSALQQFGGNIETQAAEQQAAGKPISIDKRAALAAAAPQAALDVAGNYIPLGGRLVSKLVGIPEKALLKDATGKAAKLAEEKLLATLAKGTGKGVLAEVPTEVAQQMLERAQAGLPLTNEEALNEYGETAYRTSLLGPLGAAGRLSERGGARMEVEKQKQEEKRKAQIAQTEQEEQLAQQKQAVEAAALAQRQTPQFAQEADVKYAALQKQVEDLLAASKATVDPTDLAGIAAKKEAQQKLKDLKASDEYKQTIADWRETAPIRAKMQADKDAAAAAQAAAQQQQADAAAAAAAQQQAAQMQQEEFAGPFRQPMLPGMEGIEPPAQAAPAPSEDTALSFAQKQQELEKLREDNTQQQSDAAASGDTAAWEKANRQGSLLENEYAYVTKQLDLLGGYTAPASSAAAIQKQLDKVKEELKANSGPGYDAKLAAKQVTKIKDLTAKMAEYGGVQQTLDLGRAKPLAPGESAESFNARVAETEKLKQQIAQVEAEGQAKVGPETEALQRIGERPTPPDYDLFDRAEKEPSAAMGQMKQDLTQESRTVTGEEEKQPKPIQRVAGTGEFRLTSFQTPAEGRAKREDLTQRLAQLMARKDLSPEAYDFLRDAEQYLPNSDVEVTTEATPGMKPGVKFLTAAQEDRIKQRKAAIERMQGLLEKSKTASRTASLQKQIDYSKQLLANEESLSRPMKPGAATGESFYSLLDRQLSLIESGKEGIDTRKQPRYRTVVGKEFLALPTRTRTAEGKTVTSQVKFVQDRKRVQKKGLLFSPTGAPALSLQADLEPLIARAKYGKEDTAVEQEDLFKATPKETGYIKADRAAFERLQKSPFVRQYFAKLDAATRTEASAKKRLDVLRPQIEALSKKLASMTKLQNEATSAVAAIAAGENLPKLAQDLATIAANRTASVVEKMQVEGQIEGLLQERAEMVTLVNAAPISKEDKALLLEKVDGVTEQLQQLQADLVYTDLALSMQQAQLAVAHGKQKLEQALGESSSFRVMSRLADMPAQIAKAQKELATARAEEVKAESALKKALIDREESNKDPEEATNKIKARAAEVVAAAERAAQRETAVKEENRRIQDVYSEEGRQYTALEESERFRREAKNRGDIPVIAVADKKQLLYVEENNLGKGAKDPLQVLGGYRSRIASLEKKIHRERVRTRQYIFAEIEGLKQTYEKLEAAYKAEKSGDVRAQLLPTLLAADAKYQEAYRVASNKPLTFVGQAALYKALEKAYIQEEWLSGLINSGKLKVGPEFEKPRKLTPQEKKIAQAFRAKEVSANKQAALEEGEAPATTGEPLTKMGEVKARKAQNTVYQSKGASYTELEQKQKDDEAARLRGEAPRPKATTEGTVADAQKRMTQGAPLQIEITPETKVTDIAKSIAATSTNKFNKAIAERLVALLGNTKLELVEDLKNSRGTRVFGQAKNDGSLIRLDAKYGLNEHTFLHEAIHSAIENTLRTPDSMLNKNEIAAQKELQALYEAAIKDPAMPVEYARKNLSEFVAEALSNEQLQGYLQEKPWTLQNMWKSLKNTVLKLLGIDVPSNMLEATISAADRLMVKVPRPTPDDNTLAPEFLDRPMYANDTLAAAGAIGDKFIAKNQTLFDSLKANNAGLAFETKIVDRFAGFERLSKTMPALKGTQMMYYLRMYDQRMNFVAQSVSRGALQRVEKTRPDGGKEFLIESKEGPSLKGVVETLKEAKKMVGSGQGVNRLFTLYLSAIRAQDKGLAALHFGTALTQADLDQAMKAIAATPGLKAIFERARTEYNQYNKGLINFAVQAGAIKKDVAAELLKQNDYIPWYRQRNGVAEMVIGNETPISVGSIASQPYLQELVGGDTAILDFMTSSVQNTNLLTDMALRNLATKNSVMELVAMKLAKIGSKNMAGPNVVKFRQDGEDVAAMIDTDTVGIDADILVKGMEGIPVQLSGLGRLLAFPATILRKMITVSPLYIAKQLFRDSLAAPILSGADFTPVMGALKEINGAAKDTLERRGITGGQIFTGGSEDLTKILQDIADDKTSWTQAVSKLQAVSMEADALTRRAQYNSYIKQGLSEMEATLMALESMNFNKRGSSPSIHLANSLIPFFNAQIQSMNVLYKAFRGQLPFNERLKIQEKLMARGLLVAGISMTYAAAMQDDEAYKNATPDQKYASWFIRIPGIDEPLRMPIPFEIGYIFKALPEAIVNIISAEHGGEEAGKAFLTIFKSLIPGGSSYGIPQAMKPAIEAGLGKSFYTGRDILSRQEQQMLPEAQFRADTTDIAKYIASGLNVSPIMLEHLVQGYTGTMGLALLQAVSSGVPAKGQTGPEQAYKRLSELPVIGSAFQPNDAGGIISDMYEHMLEIQKIDKTVEGLINKGLVSDAKELIAKRGNDYMMSEVAGEYISTIRELTQYENAIRASNLSPEEKRSKLDDVRQAKIKYSAQMRQAVDKTKPQ